MEEIVYYKIGESTDKNMTGVAGLQITGFIDPENDSPERSGKYQELYYDYLSEDFDLMKFCADKKAKPTDMLSANYLRRSGIFMSGNFVEFLTKFKICSYKYREVYIKYLSEKKQYKYLNLVMCPNINFGESSFAVANERTKEQLEAIKLTSLQDFRDNINKLYEEKGYSFTIEPQKLLLNETPDLFKYEISGEFLISEGLKTALESSKLTGYFIEPFETKFYY